MSLDNLRIILNDKSLDPVGKLNLYAEKYPSLVRNHPMSLVYACSDTEDVNDCIKLVSHIGKLLNFKLTCPSSAEIMLLVEDVMISDKCNIEMIFDNEIKHLNTIIGIPIIFFKSCNERKTFNKDHLKTMLEFRNRVNEKSVSQYDASVEVGTLLVDKYIKKSIP
jgi:hypothetical protein